MIDAPAAGPACRVRLANGTVLEWSAAPAPEVLADSSRSDGRRAMMRPGESVEVYLCRDPVDLRKSIQGLSVLVEQSARARSLCAAAVRLLRAAARQDQDPLLGAERVRALVQAAREGALCVAGARRRTRRLAMTGRELNWLLDGIDVFRAPPHATLRYESVL